MDIFTAATTAIVTSVLALSLKNRGELAIMISICGGVLILLQFLPQISEIIDCMKAMAQAGGMDGSYITIILKASGIAVLVAISSSICKDAGQSALAVKVEIAGRVAILITAMPVIYGLFNVITKAMR